MADPIKTKTISDVCAHFCGKCSFLTIATSAFGRLTAWRLLNSEGAGKAFLQVHPAFETPELVEDILGVAERHLSKQTDSGPRLNVWANEPHTGPLEILKTREYSPGFALEYKRRRHMEGQVEDVPRKDGHVVRALGDIEELPARSWASWAAFHPNNPDADYRGWEWYRYVQRCPLYRRDLDIVAISPNGCVASFCAAWFDAAARTGAFEPVGTDKIIGATAWVRL